MTEPSSMRVDGSVAPSPGGVQAGAPITQESNVAGHHYDAPPDQSINTPLIAQAAAEALPVAVKAHEEQVGKMESRGLVLLSTKTPSARAMLQIVTRAFTWIQGGVRRTMTLLATSAIHLSASFKVGGGVLSGAAVLANLALTYVAVRDGFDFLRKKQWSEAAQKFALFLAAGSAVVASLDAAFVAAKSLIANFPVAAFLGVIGGAISTGIGPLILTALEGLKWRKLSAEGKKIESEIKHLESERQEIEKEIKEIQAGIKAGTHTQKQLDVAMDKYVVVVDNLGIAKKQLASNNQQRNLAILKAVGNLLFGALQIGLALGTGGISIGISLAVNLGILGVAYIAEVVVARKQEQVAALTVAHKQEQAATLILPPNLQPVMIKV